MWMIEQPNWLRLVLIGNRTSSTQKVKYVGNTDVFCFGFYFMSPKRTRTRIGIGITLLLQAYSCLPLVQVVYGFLGIGPEVLIAISLVLIVHGNENPSIMFSFAYSSSRLSKCEVVNFSRSHLAGMNGRCISIFQCILIT